MACVQRPLDDSGHVTALNKLSENLIIIIILSQFLIQGRSQTIMFSEKAVICQRDDEYYLLFRVGDMRKSHIVEAHVRAILVRKRVTQEGEVTIGNIWPSFK